MGHRTSARRAPQIRGVRVFLRVIEIGDQLVLRRHDRAHRVHHRDLVELVGAEDGVPPSGGGTVTTNPCLMPVPL